MDKLRGLRSSERGSAVPWIILVIVLIGVAAVGYWVWQHRHNTPTPTTGMSACTSDDLSLSMGTSEGTAGTIYKHAVLTNTSGASCTITGYPAAFLVDGSGGVLGDGAASSALYTPVAITLAAGGKAHTVLGFPDAGNFDAGICSSAASQLKLYLPGSVSYLETTETDQSCPGFSATAMQSGA